MKPCPIRINCPDGTDSPFTNISSEAPDLDLEWTFNNGVSGLWPPLSNDNWDWPTVPVWCANDPFNCQAPQLPTASGGNPGEGDPGWTTGGGTRVPFYYNQTQTATVTCADGTSFSYTVQAGITNALSQDLANQIALSQATIIANRYLVCLGDLSPYGCQDIAYRSQASTSGGVGPFTYGLASGMIPPGLFPKTAANGDFLLEGTPNLAGNYSFGISVTDPLGHVSVKHYTIAILNISNAKTLAHAMEGRAYSQQLNVVGGTGPYTFLLVIGSLGSNLTLSASGLITGTPDYITSGSRTANIKVTDSNGAVCSQDVTVVTDVAPGPNWDAFVWSFPSNTKGSGSGVGRTASAQCSFDGNIPFASVTLVTATGVNYTGPSVNARVAITVSYNGVAGGNDITFQVKKAGVVQTGFGGPKATGSYNFDFATGVGAGEAWTIDDAGPVNSFCGINNLGNVSGCSLTFQIFNL